MTRQSFRSPLARALGLGAAKSGVQHWWAERVTAVALVPLCLWFAASIIAHAGSDYAGFIAWIRTPLATGCIILLLIALFHHSALGLQVVIKDYVHSGVKLVAVIAVRFAAMVSPWLESSPSCASSLANQHACRASDLTRRPQHDERQRSSHYPDCGPSAG